MAESGVTIFQNGTLDSVSVQRQDMIIIIGCIRLMMTKCVSRYIFKHL